MSSKSHLEKIPILDGTNYLQLAWMMQAYLSTQSLYGLISGAWTDPVEFDVNGNQFPTFNEEHRKYLIAWEALHSAITLTITENIQDELAEKNGIEAWNYLHSNLAAIHLVLTFQTFMQVLRFQLNLVQHPMLQIQVLRGLYEQLKQQGAEIPESLQDMLLLAALPSQWQTSLVSIAMNKATLADIHIIELQATILAHWETTQTQKISQKGTKGTLLAANKLSSIKKKKGQSNPKYSDQKGKGKAPSQGNSLPSAPGGGSGQNSSLNKCKRGKCGGKQQHTHFASQASCTPPTSHTIVEIGHLISEPTLLQHITVENNTANHTSNSFYPSFMQVMELAKRSGQVCTPYRVQQAEVPIMAVEDEFGWILCAKGSKAEALRDRLHGHMCIAQHQMYLKCLEEKEAVEKAEILNFAKGIQSEWQLTNGEGNMLNPSSPYYIQTFAHLRQISRVPTPEEDTVSLGASENKELLMKAPQMMPKEMLDTLLGDKYDGIFDEPGELVSSSHLASLIPDSSHAVTCILMTDSKGLEVVQEYLCSCSKGECTSCVACA